MATLIMRRAAGALAVLLLAVALNFLIPRLMPGSPLRALVGGGDPGQLTSAQRADILAQYGLDQPLGAQFAAYLAGLARGDLGVSLSDGRPVATHLAERARPTLLLVGSALVVTTALGVGLGAGGASLRQRRGDTPALVTVLALDALPPFWVGTMLALLFGVTLGWLPTFGARPLAGLPAGIAGILATGRHLVLPLATLVIASVGQTYLVTRSSMLSVLGSTPLEHARARGLAGRHLLVHHALRAAALPITTLVLLEVGWLIGGDVLVETVFAYPGLGRLTFDAVQARDYPLLQGAFLLLTVAVIVANLAADLVYPFLDPRVRSRGEAA